MAGLEVVVRPVVLPNIRPSPARSLPPADNPESGFCTIRGNPATQVDLSNSWSRSMSRSHHVETERRVDDARVYQMNDDGTVNRKNFVDVEVANKIKTRGGKRPALDGRTPIEVTSEEDTGGGVTVPGGSSAKGNATEIATWYARQLEAQNVEIKRRDRTKKNEGAEKSE